MNRAVKTTGAAAGIALALVDIGVWVAHLVFGVDVPAQIMTDITTLVTFALGYLLHDTPAPAAN